jgi:hypothetical protein
LACTPPVFSALGKVMSFGIAGPVHELRPKDETAASFNTTVEHMVTIIFRYIPISPRGSDPRDTLVALRYRL